MCFLKWESSLGLWSHIVEDVDGVIADVTVKFGKRVNVYLCLFLFFVFVYITV